MDDTSSPLVRAHTLAAHGHHTAAAAQFALAEQLADDPAVRKTLKALRAQNERLAAASARRQSSGSPSTSSSPASPRPASAAASPGVPKHHRSRKLRTPPPPFALPPPDAASASSAPGSQPHQPASPSASQHRSSLIRQAAERARTHRQLGLSSISVTPEKSVLIGERRERGKGKEREGTMGASGWSAAGESSFLVTPREKLDPFQRFWGAVEGMLEDYSHPVAFASAPLGSYLEARTGRSSSLGARAGARSSTLKRSVTGPAKLDGGSEKDSPRADDSFCLVPSATTSPSSSFDSLPLPPPSPSKTPEELALENAELRKAVDRLARRGAELELRVRTLESIRGRGESSDAGEGKEDGAAAPRAGRSGAEASLNPSPAALSEAAADTPLNLGLLKLEVERVWRSEEERVLGLSRVLLQQPPRPARDGTERMQQLELQLARLQEENARQKGTIARLTGGQEDGAVGLREER